MATNWTEFAKSVAPIGAAIIAVFGVWVGAGLNRKSSLRSFTMERVFKEIERRRELAVEYKKAAWAFASRVEQLRKLTHELVAAKKAGKEVEAKFDFPGTRERGEKLREAFADLESFSTTDVQVPARAAMEALTKCFNACSRLDLTEADAQFATYRKQWEATAVELNKESEHFNAIIYASFTPVWRAILRRSLRKPLPFKPMEHPTEMRISAERVDLKKVNANERSVVIENIGPEQKRQQ